MVSNRQPLTLALILFSLVVSLAGGSWVSANPSAAFTPRNATLQFAAFSASTNARLAYRWNMEDHQAPLLGFAEERIRGLFDHTLTYSSEGFDFPIFKALNFDEREGKYLLPTISRESGSLHFIEFAPAGSPNTYASADGTNMQLSIRTR